MSTNNDNWGDMLKDFENINAKEEMELAEDKEYAKISKEYNKYYNYNKKKEKQDRDEARRERNRNRSLELYREKRHFLLTTNTKDINQNIFTYLELPILRKLQKRCEKILGLIIPIIENKEKLERIEKAAIDTIVNRLEANFKRQEKTNKEQIENKAYTDLINLLK